MTVHLRFLLLTAALVCALFLTGCGGVMKIGRFPEISRLESDLRIRESTREDVLQVLGRPKGSGGLFLPIDDHPRQCFYYYYEEATLQESQRAFLFVLFDEDLYDGYMWFSSFPASMFTSRQDRSSLHPAAGPLRSDAGPIPPTPPQTP